MLKRFLTTALTILVTALPLMSAQTDTDTVFNSGKPMSVGLVLSGGGAKGIAHIGVIRALEENNIPIDYIAGTSMGAIIGGLYACGYTTDEMMQLLTSKDFSYWSTGRIDPAKIYYFSKEPAEPTMYTFEVNTHPHDSAANAASAVPASLINPLPMNFAFMELFAKYTAECGGDFDKLMIPFRCVASDVESGRKIVHRSGDVGDAIRSSMTFPIVFQPIRINGALLYDGGIFDNFPVDVMTNDFAPDIILGIDVSSQSKEPQTSLMDQIDNLVTRRQSNDVAADRGIKMHIELDRFSLLDFAAAPSIEKIGYDRAMEMMDSIKTRVTSRISPVTRNTLRGVFKSRTPELIFDSVSVTGASERQNNYIRYLFETAHTDTFGMAHARQSFYRAISPGRLRDLFPQAVYNDSTDMFALHLKASPKDRLGIGVGGYITSSSNSYIFLGTSWRMLTFTSLKLSLNGWIGQNYLAGYFNGSLNLHTAIPSSIGATAVVSKNRYYETDHLFFDVKTPSFVIDKEAFARIDYAWATGQRGKMTASLGYGGLYSNFFRTNSRVSYDIGRDHTKYRLAQLRLGYRSGTLDQPNFPTKGYDYAFTAMGVMGNFEFKSADQLVSDEYSHPKWLQVESATRNYFDLSKHFSLGLETDVLLSTRKLHDNYNATIVTAPEYNPTPASYSVFSAAYHANSYAAVGLVPVYKYNASLTARLGLHCFMPLRRIEAIGDKACYGKWFHNPEFYSELDICYTLPFATIAAYTGYATGRSKSWSAGISFGVFIKAPEFLR